MMISLFMIGLEAALAAGLITLMRSWHWPLMWQATGPALGLMLSLGFAAVLKARLLGHILGHPVSGWRWPLIWAAAAAVVVGELAILLAQAAEAVVRTPGVH